MVFDIVAFIFTDEKTGRLINNPLWLNDLLISMVRTVAYLVWVVPVFYLFWPNIIQNPTLSANPNKRTIAGHTLPSGLLYSRDISGYLVEGEND